MFTFSTWLSKYLSMANYPISDSDFSDIIWQRVPDTVYQQVVSEMEAFIKKGGRVVVLQKGGGVKNEITTIEDLEKNLKLGDLQRASQEVEAEPPSPPSEPPAQ
jgi:hypothetical protein